MRVLCAAACLCLAVLLAARPALADQSISVSAINLGMAGEDDFYAGQIVVRYHPVYWESDIPWMITVRSLDADLGMSGDGSYIKPLADLQWKLSDENQWIAMRQDEEEVDSSSDTGSGAVTMDFRALLNWKRDRPGDYRATLRFTITGQ